MGRSTEEGIKHRRKVLERANGAYSYFISFCFRRINHFPFSPESYCSFFIYSLFYTSPHLLTRFPCFISNHKNILYTSEISREEEGTGGVTRDRKDGAEERVSWKFNSRDMRFLGQYCLAGLPGCKKHNLVKQKQTNVNSGGNFRTDCDSEF